MTELNDRAISLIRTIVPSIVAQIMTWLAAQGILDATGEISSLLIALLTILFTALYYGLARWLETHISSKFGWLLGVPKAPQYK